MNSHRIGLKLIDTRQSVDKKEDKILRIDMKNFVTFIELRDRKIDNILK